MTDNPGYPDDPRLKTPAWQRLRLVVLDRDRWVCQIKGPDCTQVATTADHIISRAEGGDMWNPANLRAACRTCNSQAGAHIANQRRAARYRTTVAEYTTRM